MQIYLLFSSQGTFQWRDIQARVSEGKKDHWSAELFMGLPLDPVYPLGICILAAHHYDKYFGLLSH